MSAERGTPAEEIQQTKAPETKAGYISGWKALIELGQWLFPVLEARPGAQP